MTKLASVISTIALGTSFLACAGLGVAAASNAFSEDKAIEVEAAHTPTGNQRIIFFTKPSDWGTVYCHNWGGSSAGTSWPGTEMSYLYNNDYNEPIYFLNIPSDRTGIIFNNNSGTQTADITGFTLDNTNGWYYSGGKGMPWDASSIGVWSGDKVYLKFASSFDDNSAYSFWFFDGPNGAYWSSFGSKVTDSGVANVLSKDCYEITVPGTNCYFPKMIATRYDSSKTPSSSEWGGVYNQTDDLHLSPGMSTVQFDSYRNGGNRVNSTLSADLNYVSVHTNVWGYHIVNKTNTPCADPHLGPSSFSTVWPTLKSEYTDSLDDSIRNAFADATAKADGTYTEKGAQRYDTIVTKFGAEKFAKGRAGKTIINEFTTIKESDIKVAPFVIAGIIGFSIAGGFIFYKTKRKE